MCLTINTFTHEKTLVVDHRYRVVTKCFPKVIEEDMTVFKCVHTDGKAEYQKFWYDPNTLYKKRKLRPTKEAVYGAGFHAYTSSPVRVYKNRMVIMATIPKGSTVFFGVDGDVVTNALKTLEFPKRYKGHDRT